MLEKDENKRFDINEVDGEMKRINFVVDKVNNKQELEKKLVVKESIVKSVSMCVYSYVFFHNRVGNHLSIIEFVQLINYYYYIMSEAF